MQTVNGHKRLGVPLDQYAFLCACGDVNCEVILSLLSTADFIINGQVYSQSLTTCFCSCGPPSGYPEVDVYHKVGGIAL